MVDRTPAGPRASDHDTHVTPDADHRFQVIIVGGGPGGAATALAMAQRGLDVLLLEKDEYPREKVCGDGLTPRAVRMLERLGVDTSEDAGWVHNRGLRVYAGKTQGMELAWPDLKDIPNYGMVCARREFDDLLAGYAIEAGATVITGAQVETLLERRFADGLFDGVQTTDGRIFRSDVIVLADGNASRMSRQLAGFGRNPKRPMGVAVRAYYSTTRPVIDHMESWLELWDGEVGNSTLLPGYGWLFDMGDGTVNIGLGMLNTSKAFGKTDYRELLKRWVASLPPEWGISEETRLTPIRGAALPMGINRKLSHGRVLLVGDAAGMISPFNGEGISYAMEAGEIAADTVAEAFEKGLTSQEGRHALLSYPKRVREAWGGYFRLGTIFSKLIGKPAIMHASTTYGLPRKRLMKFVHKMLANLVDSRGGDFDDRVLSSLSRLAPSV